MSFAFWIVVSFHRNFS